MSDGLPSSSILDNILADVNAVVPNFVSLVSSYRLLVGAAEEIGRIPGVPEEIFRRAVIRFDRAGTLIDIILELLCCKISYSSEFLAITCAPIDLLQLVANNSSADYTPKITGDQILLLEVIRRVLEQACPDLSCFGPPPPGITKQPPPAPASPPAFTPPRPPYPLEPPPAPAVNPPCPLTPPAYTCTKKDGEGSLEFELEPDTLRKSRPNADGAETEPDGTVCSPLRRKYITNYIRSKKQAARPPARHN